MKKEAVKKLSHDSSRAHSQIYFEAIDLAVSSIISLIKIFPNIEELLFKASSRQNYEGKFLLCVISMKT